MNLEKVKEINILSMPGFHRRGKPTQEALYDLHSEQLRKQEIRREWLAQREAEEVKKGKFVNLESSELRIQGFKKEFRQVLYKVVTLPEEQKKGKKSNVRSASRKDPLNSDLADTEIAKSYYQTSNS